MPLCLFDRIRAILFVLRPLLPVFLLVSLIACESVDDDRFIAFQDDEDQSHEIFQNVGAKFQPTATKMDWLRHGLRLFFGLYPGSEALPDDHVLPKALANEAFQAAIKQNNSLTWFGHGTFLINVGGQKILIDPTLARRIGRSLLTMGRMTPSLPNWRMLGRLDAVLITHADYDHLDLTSLRMLRQLHPKLHLFVPAGTKRMLEGMAPTDVTELRWGQAVRLGRLEIHFVPAVHGTRRIPYALNSALWGGYIIRSGQRKLYLSGDIAEGKIYNKMARTYGPVTTAIVPIGGYAPQSFNRAFHASPEGTLDIARRMGAREIIASHWGTFALSAETAQEQKKAFLEAAKAKSAKVSILQIGQSRRLW